jgi:intron-binding protein aquarius
MLGTGKTDIAVQIIANLYHNNPQQHILVVTRSNQALNHLFEKIYKLDIDPRHLLRLGHGQDDLETVSGASDWGKAGRINSFLELRIELLNDVNRLAASIGVLGAHGDTCANASFFNGAYVQPKWNAFLKKTSRRATKELIAAEFPFAEYFKDSIHFFEDKDVKEAAEVAKSLYSKIEDLFEKLETIHPFELLRGNRDRANYLLVKEARIICMTTTHASLKRRELVRLGFRYDSVIMEEAGQLLEVETFIPLLLQNRDHEPRLKRICLIGDHHQLAPVVKNNALRQYGNLQQSLFARLVRLEVPVVQLDMQARCRPSIADLYRWNYDNLNDLPAVHPKVNPGFCHEYQFINVPDYLGKGETMPRAFFTQNLGEAEYVVSTYQYMLQLGYIFFTLDTQPLRLRF